MPRRRPTPVPPRRRPALVLAAALVTALPAGLLAPGPASAAAERSAAGSAPGQAVAVGSGGAVATVDADATLAGLRVLNRGGNAADAAVAAAAALGVTEPYSAGLGGGGFLLHHDSETGEVTAIDGRETAPAAMGADAFLDPETGAAIPFAEAVASGLSVGTPGTPRTWQVALEEFGSQPLSEVLQPAIRIASRGFVVDETFRAQTEGAAARFARFTPSAELFLPGGAPPEVGSVFRNRDLAQTYATLAAEGLDAFYTGALAEEVAATAQEPPLAPAPPDAAPVRPGLLTTHDLARYEAPLVAPTRVDYRGLEVFGMAPPSSGGSTVGEALNVLEALPLTGADPVDALHLYLEASAVAFADRNAYVGDPAYNQVPAAELLSDGFGAERSCAVDPAAAQPKPLTAGVPDGDYAPCVPGGGGGAGATADDVEGLSTTHLTVVDGTGDVVSYTLTIEQTGGSGIVVPGRGFLLNNELTDFTFRQADPTRPEPNLPAPGKRPRSSMSPTIVLSGGEPLLALGSPGGSTIITTVLQVLVGRLDLGLDLAEAVAAPRATQRNTASVVAEPAFRAAYGADLAARGHAFTDSAEIGAVTAIEVLPDGRLLAVAEPERRGGGSAGVLRPSATGTPAP